MEIGERIICSEDKPDQIRKGEGLAGNNDCHYIPGLPIEHPMTLMLQRPERAGSTQEVWEQNSTFRSSLNTPGACQEWLGIVWRVCASSCQELRVPARVRSNWPLQEQSQGSLSDWEWHGVGRVKL